MSSNKERNFKDLVELYKAASFEENTSGATLTITTEELCSIVSDIIELPQDFGITVESGHIEVGSSLTLNIKPPRIRLGQFHRTFDDYLKNAKNRTKEANNFFIVDINYYNRDKNSPSIIKKYRKVLQLISLFKESSAYLDETNFELIFVDSNVLKIPTLYSSAELELIDDELVNNIIANFAEDTHKEQKLTILANSIKSICESKTKERSFPFLLSELPQLLDSFQKGYKVFVSGFSYEKILDQLRVAKIEEMGKIHKVFSDIQNQILGIPVATIIVATQMKQTVKWDSQALINTAILLGAIFFTTMIVFVLFNQWQTLSAISDELKHKKKQAKNNYSAIYTDINGTFNSLSMRLLAQKAVFVFLGLFVTTGLYLTFKFYFLLTPYAHSYLFG